jgi:hypothetical protein
MAYIIYNIDTDIDTFVNLQVFHPRCVLCKRWWIGPSKHNGLSKAIY